MPSLAPRQCPQGPSPKNPLSVFQSLGQNYVIYPSVYNLKKDHFNVFQDTHTDTVESPSPRPPPPAHLFKLLTRDLRKLYSRRYSPHPNRSLMCRAKCSESKGGRSDIRTVSKAPSVRLSAEVGEPQRAKQSRFEVEARSPAVPRGPRATPAQLSEQSR